MVGNLSTMTIANNNPKVILLGTKGIFMQLQRVLMKLATYDIGIGIWLKMIFQIRIINLLLSIPY